MPLPSNPTSSPFQPSPAATPQPPPPASPQSRRPPRSAPNPRRRRPNSPPPANLTSADQIPPPPLHWFPALHLPPNRARFNTRLKGAAQGEGREEQCSGREARRRHHHRCYFVRAHPVARLTDGNEAQGVVLPHLPVHPIFRHQVTNCLCLSPCLVGPLGPDLIRCRWGWDLPLLLLLGDRRSG